MLALSHREAAPMYLQLYRVGVDVLHLLVVNLPRHKCGKLKQHMTGSNPQPAAKCL